MSTAKTLIGEAQNQGADVPSLDLSPHWSLAPSSWPGTDTPVSYPARAWRTRARLQVLSAWQERLRLLSHYDPDYVYDPGYEYEEGWTTDPAYRRDRVRLYRFNSEGFLMPPGSFHSRFLDLVLQTLCLVLGRRVCREPDLHYPSAIGEELDLFTQGGTPRNLTVPDLAVMPRSWTLTEERERTVEERIIRWDEGDPSPELVVEVLSGSTEAKDFEDNLSLYAKLGISEYLIVETGERKSEPNMWLYRLDKTDGNYHMVEVGLALTACGTPMRLLPADIPGNVPVFQCQDTKTWHWHDYEGSIARRGEVRTAMQLLDAALPLLPAAHRTHIEGSWLEGGLPSDTVQRILSLQGEPDRWRELLETPLAPEAADETEGAYIQ